ncbi:MAG: acyl-CoA dehydrogenase family protein [Acidimicrobiia bacterium]
MAWDFSTEPEFQEKLDWARRFIDEEVQPLEVLFPESGFLPLDDTRRAVVDPLKQQVRDRGLWAAHLPPSLGGQGYGALKLALLNEILGRVGVWGSIVFGTQAPDTGNAEIIARFGTDAQKRRFLQPLLAGEIFSCFSMTEPQGGADPGVFTTRAVRDGDEWVIDGQKYWSSNASVASFFIIMAVTNPDVPVHRGTSMFLVPADTPGVNIAAKHNLYGHPEYGPGHGLMSYERLRVPHDAMLGNEGEGFKIAQSRLAGGRIHHAMRSVGLCQRAIDMMCERAKSRFTQGSRLSDKQFVQGYIADSVTELMQYRLAVLYTSWKVDQVGEEACRQEIGALKIATPRVIESIVRRAIQVHGGLGLTEEMPLAAQYMAGMVLGLADGPTEVHQINLARGVLKGYDATDGLWPTQSRGVVLEALRDKYAGVVEPIPYIPTGPPSPATTV